MAPRERLHRGGNGKGGNACNTKGWCWGAQGGCSRDTRIPPCWCQLTVQHCWPGCGGALHAGTRPDGHHAGLLPGEGAEDEWRRCHPGDPAAAAWLHRDVGAGASRDPVLPARSVGAAPRQGILSLCHCPPRRGSPCHDGATASGVLGAASGRGAAAPKAQLTSGICPTTALERTARRREHDHFPGAACAGRVRWRQSLRNGGGPFPALRCCRLSPPTLKDSPVASLQVCVWGSGGQHTHSWLCQAPCQPAAPPGSVSSRTLGCGES